MIYKHDGKVCAHVCVCAYTCVSVCVCVPETLQLFKFSYLFTWRRRECEDPKGGVGGSKQYMEGGSQGVGGIDIGNKEEKQRV